MTLTPRGHIKHIQQNARESFALTAGTEQNKYCYSGYLSLCLTLSCITRPVCELSPDSNIAKSFFGSLFHLFPIRLPRLRLRVPGLHQGSHGLADRKREAKGGGYFFFNVQHRRGLMNQTSRLFIIPMHKQSTLPLHASTIQQPSFGFIHCNKENTGRENIFCQGLCRHARCAACSDPLHIALQGIAKGDCVFQCLLLTCHTCAQLSTPWTGFSDIWS